MAAAIYFPRDLKLNQAAAAAKNKNIRPNAVPPDDQRKMAPVKKATARIAKRIRLFIKPPDFIAYLIVAER